MTERVGPNGELHIPEELRQRAGLGEGSAIRFALENGVIAVYPAEEPGQPPGGRFEGSDLGAGLPDGRRLRPPGA